MRTMQNTSLDLLYTYMITLSWLDVDTEVEFSDPWEDGIYRTARIYGD